VGIADGLHLTAIYTDRANGAGAIRRIISARRSNRRERQASAQAHQQEAWPWLGQPGIAPESDRGADRANLAAGTRQSSVRLLGVGGDRRARTEARDFAARRSRRSRLVQGKRPALSVANELGAPLLYVGGARAAAACSESERAAARRTPHGRLSAPHLPAPPAPNAACSPGVILSALPL